MPDFEIGNTLEEMTNLSQLETPVEHPKSQYVPYRTVNKGNGGKRGTGFPVAQWDFPLLTLNERNQLKEFCPGASADVYIHTKLNDDSYEDFKAIMIWPDGPEDRWVAGEKKNFSILFRNLVPIESS